MTLTSRSRNSRGFTLIEILLGLAVFAIISTVLYSTFSAGIKTSRRSEKQSRIVKQATWILDAMAKDLEQGIFFSFSSLDESFSAFDAQPDRFSVIVPAKTGLKRVSYYLEDVSNARIHKTVIGRTTKKNVNIVLTDQTGVPAKVLIREEQDLTDHLSGSDEREFEVLSSSVRSEGLTFDYQMAGEEGKVFPASVDVVLTFIAEDYPDGVLPLKKHILIPTMMFKFSLETPAI